MKTLSRAFLLLISMGIMGIWMTAGCSGSKSGSGFGDDNNNGGNDAGGTATVDGSNGNDGPTFGGGDSAACTATCGDLHTVVCNGTPVQTCAGDQGCLNGACVAACDAAKATKSTVGCDYYAVNPDTTFAAGACFAAFIANTWTSPVTVNVTFGGQTLQTAGLARIPKGSGQATTYQALPGNQIPAGEIAILFLAQGPTAPAMYTPACPSGVTPGVATDPAPHGTTIGQAFHITTSAPVVAYDIFPYGGGVSAITSATLLLPTTSWDTNYIAVDAYGTPSTTGTGGITESNDPFIDIVASEDGTHVTISPTAAIVGGTGVAATALGTPVTYTLNTGQVLNLIQDAELNGSPIQADKPIGLWGGNSCMDLPVGQQACDAAHQQIPPVQALGNEYVALRYRNRFSGTGDETPPWRVLGAVDGTTLSYDPAPPAGAPTSLASGQLVEFNAAGPFTVKSQDTKHPFYISAHMTGGTTVDPTQTEGRGDPEFVNIIPPAQYLNDYVFFTDPTYPETDLCFVREQATDGTFKDVSLDCAGTLTGWQPVGTGGKYEYTRVDLVTGNFQPQGSCDNGRHEAKSDGPFGVTVWAWGSAATGGDITDVTNSTGFYSQWVSYAYPAGASVQSINQVVVPPAPR